LYNIREDHGQQRDLSQAFPDVVERLRNQLETWNRALPGL